MKILGIDPAPSKKSIIFDGKNFIEKEPFEVKIYLEDEKKVNQEYLITWDAPLGDDFSHSLSQKKIEKILSSKDSYIDEQKPPQGISTLPFSGCSHWTISQYTLGYPIINHDLICHEKLKYHLVKNDMDFSTDRANVIEAHPTFALWVWMLDFKNKLGFKNSWRYKGGGENKRRFQKIIELFFELDFVKTYRDIKYKIISDDYLDAFVCYLLGKLFLKKRAFIYHDKNGGYMLLPDMRGILKEEILEKDLIW